jgi:hypothetical protein
MLAELLIFWTPRANSPPPIARAGSHGAVAESGLRMGIGTGLAVGLGSHSAIARRGPFLDIKMFKQATH